MIDPLSILFRWTPENRAALAAFNARWEERFTRFRRTAGAPWWAPGLILTPELHQRYEAWLPQAEYRRDLTALAARLLPGRAWVPWRLRDPDGGGVLSLPDLWQRLPAPLAGHAGLETAVCNALLCALADPPRFGTDTGRYPEQLRRVTELLTTRPKPLWRVLDLGCGTGHGTWEVALAAAETGAKAHIVGVTREPLEAWMATHQRLPHDPARERRYPSPPGAAAGHVQFVAADGLTPPLRPGAWDLILVNGLAGGPHLNAPESMHRLLRGLAQLLAPGGAACCACRFHDGYAPHLDAFAALARTDGWQLSGPLRQLWLEPPTHATPH